MELTDKMLANKERFIALLKEINRPGARVDMLVDKLEKSDFFYAPASTKYHNSFAGGLCEHCLNVYEELLGLVTSHNVPNITRENIIIVSLLHDLSKMDYYESTVMNKKVYQENGSKYDEMGRYDWVSVSGFKTKDIDARFFYSTHEVTAEFMARCFVPLTIEESVAILHHSGYANKETSANLTTVFNRYPLALFLHEADMLATFYRERT